MYALIFFCLLVFLIVHISANLHQKSNAELAVSLLCLHCNHRFTDNNQLMTVEKKISKSDDYEALSLESGSA